MLDDVIVPTELSREPSSESLDESLDEMEDWSADVNFLLMIGQRPTFEYVFGVDIIFWCFGFIGGDVLFECVENVDKFDFWFEFVFEKLYGDEGSGCMKYNEICECMLLIY